MHTRAVIKMCICAFVFMRVCTNVCVRISMLPRDTTNPQCGIQYKNPTRSCHSNCSCTLIISSSSDANTNLGVHCQVKAIFDTSEQNVKNNLHPANACRPNIYPFNKLRFICRQSPGGLYPAVLFVQTALPYDNYWTRGTQANITSQMVSSALQKSWWAIKLWLIAKNQTGEFTIYDPIN